MKLIKAQFFSKYTGEPYGKHYTYDAGEHDVIVGDIVQLNEDGKGIVTAVNVPEKEIEAFKDKIKTIIGKSYLEETQINELKIIEKQMPIIKTNAKELRKYVEKLVTKYKGLVVMEDSYKDLKRDRADLNKVVEKIDRARIDVKKELSTPITKFEDEMKDIACLVKTTSDNLNEQIKAHEDKLRDGKMQELINYRSQKVKESGLPEKYIEEIEIPGKYANISASLADGKTQIDFAIKGKLGVIELKKRESETIKTMAQTLSASLETPLNPEPYIKEYKANDNINAFSDIVDKMTKDSQRQLKIETETKQRLKEKEEQERKEREERERKEQERLAELNRQEELEKALKVFEKKPKLVEEVINEPSEEIANEPEYDFFKPTQPNGKVTVTWRVTGYINDFNVLKDMAEQLKVIIEEE